MEWFMFLIRFYQDGGFFMHPITLVLALGVAIVVERYMYLKRVEQDNKKTWDAIMPALEKGEIQKAEAILAMMNTDLGKVIGYGLARAKSSTKREDIEVAMEEGLMEVTPQLEKRTHYLAAFANMSTLLGLLGTIVGLIQAFAAVANASPDEKATLLSAAVSTALNTTAYGLVVGIPLLFLFTVLQSKTTDLVDKLEMATVKFLNIVTDRKS